MHLTVVYISCILSSVSKNKHTKEITNVEELEYTIKMNKHAILARLERVQDVMKDLQTTIENEIWNGDSAMTWVDGHAAEEVTAISSLIARQRALLEALHIVKKNS
jgi:hypothetical protein